MNLKEPNYYLLEHADELRTPNLLLYPNLVKENIQKTLSEIAVDRFRPHIKTNKSPNLIQLLLDQGVYKFKCATLQEAQMLAELNVKDILIAYPIVGSQLNYVLDLVQRFPNSTIRFLVDSELVVNQLNDLFAVKEVVQEVFVDLNLGMNRTGVTFDRLEGFVAYIHTLSNVKLVGLHGYDGHIREENIEKREQIVKEYFEEVLARTTYFENTYGLSLSLVFGGSNTFPIYRQYSNVECSPGTFILWDWGYHSTLPEQTYQIAALLISRVVSKPNTNLLCLDLGYKAISSENTLDKRLHFLHKLGWNLVSQSEEHLVVDVPSQDWEEVNIGEFIYIVPYHICPTVAMYPAYQVVGAGKVTEEWGIWSRY